MHLRGLLKGGTPGANDAGRAFTLPEGNRPTYRQLHAVCTNNNRLGRVNVLANGNVVVVSGDTGWMSLDSIAFQAADSLASKGPAEEVLPRIVSGVRRPAMAPRRPRLASAGDRSIDRPLRYHVCSALCGHPSRLGNTIWAGLSTSGVIRSTTRGLVSLEQAKMRVQTGDNTGRAYR